MKRKLLFVQGGGARVHDEWDGKLVESLRRLVTFTLCVISAPMQAWKT
jgi:hypothetical protein